MSGLKVTPPSGGPSPSATVAAGVAVAGHVAAADPHTVYQLRSEKGAANGYAELGATGLVPMDQLATGTPDGTQFVRDDGTLAVPAGGATAYASLTDVDTTGVSDGDMMAWDATSSLWLPVAPPSGTVPSGSAVGDLLVWDGAAWSPLSVSGTNGRVLTEDSGETLGLKFAASAGGGLASPDDIPASPSADDIEFSSTLGTWTAHGTLDAFNITDYPGLGVHILKTATGGFTLHGEFAAIPAGGFPFFVWWKIEDMQWDAAYQECGVALAAAGTNGPYFVWGGLATNNYGWAIYNTRTSRSTWGGDIGIVRHAYCGIMATSTTNLATYISENGTLWRAVSTGINPGFTITQFGPFVTGQDNSVKVDAIMRFIRFRASV